MQGDGRRSSGQMAPLSSRRNQQKKEKIMTQSTKDQIEGKLHQVTGDAKEKAGELLDNSEMAAEGRDESLSGSIQKKIGEIKKVFGK
jgi:uncharacterized protein YjbJ (UPF0337 family)